MADPRLFNRRCAVGCLGRECKAEAGGEGSLKILARILFAAGLLALAACATAPQGDSVLTFANVSVSNGRTYTIETYYTAPDHAAVRQTRPDGEINTSIIAGDAMSPADGGAMLRTIVLGHQFHAVLVKFDTVLTNVRDGTVDYAGERRTTREGDWPYGGTVRLVQSASGGHPEAFLFNMTGAPEIRVTFSDWRGDLPFHMTIDDGSNSYEYTFTAVTLDAPAPDWAGLQRRE